MASKIVGVKIAAGQRIRLESPGGGGWGDPMARPREAVARDIRLGFVSGAASRDYGYAP
jgi:N-methylhydantoinase B